MMLARRLRLLLRRPFRKRPRRLWVLLAGLTAILVWQRNFVGADLKTGYKFTHSSGVHRESNFVYFLYYLGLYPVASTEKKLRYSETGARNILARKGETLVNDKAATFRSGDRGRTLVFLYDAWLKGTPRKAQLRPFHTQLFRVALYAVFAAFWWIRQPLLGAFIVLFVGSHPAQLYAVYAQEDVHGWTITTALLLLALHVPLMKDRTGWWKALGVAALSGVLLASVRTIRSEPTPMLVAAAFVYLTLDARWRLRVTATATLAATFLLATAAWTSWFRHKFDEARAVVARAGGHPYPSTYVNYHEFWHPVWCGLGDFDTKYGYKWDDRAAYTFAEPILREKYGVTVPPRRPHRYWSDAYWDDAKQYRMKTCELPHYYDIVRDKVLKDIRHDPVWYLQILGKRVGRIVTQVTPLRVAVASLKWSVHWTGWTAIALAGLLGYLRAQFLLKLLLFTVPTSAVAFVIFSGRGTTYLAIYHLVAAAILATLLVELAISLLARRRRGAVA